MTRSLGKVRALAFFLGVLTLVVVLLLLIQWERRLSSPLEYAERHLYPWGDSSSPPSPSLSLPPLSLPRESPSPSLSLPPIEPLPPERYVIDSHRVEPGEFFSLITGFYWDDLFLWPDLYVRNTMQTEDPDLIYPGEEVDIYNQLGKGGTLSREELNEVLNSYLKVYHIYKALGPRKNNSVWALLASAEKYDPDFMEKYGEQIDSSDKKAVEKHMKEADYLG